MAEKIIFAIEVKDRMLAMLKKTWLGVSAGLHEVSLVTGTVQENIHEAVVRKHARLLLPGGGLARCVQP
jgi:hypothetical protein